MNKIKGSILLIGITLFLGSCGNRIDVSGRIYSNFLEPKGAKVIFSIQTGGESRSIVKQTHKNGEFTFSVRASPMEEYTLSVLGLKNIGRVSVVGNNTVVDLKVEKDVDVDFGKLYIYNQIPLQINSTDITTIREMIAIWENVYDFPVQYRVKLLGAAKGGLTEIFQSELMEAYEFNFAEKYDASLFKKEYISSAEELVSGVYAVIVTGYAKIDDSFTAISESPALLFKLE
jgi:hypothetical protein